MLKLLAGHFLSSIYSHWRAKCLECWPLLEDGVCEVVRERQISAEQYRSSLQSKFNQLIMLLLSAGTQMLLNFH